MISYNQIEKGTEIIINNQPYEVIEALSLFKGRGHSTLQVKLKNLINNEIISKTFHPSDSFQEPDISKRKAKFLYSHRDKFVFSEEKDPSQRFELNQEQIGSVKLFLKPNQIIEALVYEEKIVNISLPVKINLKVTEAPPGVKGGRAQGGNKIVTLETKAKINVPLFVEQGDIIEVNTEKQEYVRRVSK